MGWSKGGEEMKISGKRLAWVMLNLLEVGTGRKRKTVSNDIAKKKMSARSYEDVWKWIKEYLEKKGGKDKVE